MANRLSRSRIDLPRPSVPDVGDVIVREDWVDGKRRFVFQTVPGPEQYIVRSRTAALSQALDFARRLQVRLWIGDGSEDYTLIEDFRSAPQLRPGQRR